MLVVIDYFFRWPEVLSVHTTDAHNIIKSMELIFQTHGQPECVSSDNGQPFTSAEFGKFLSDLGIIHHKGVPYWPQSNGKVERLNGTVLKIMRIFFFFLIFIKSSSGLTLVFQTKFYNYIKGKHMHIVERIL